jgi:hypothetical protein
MPDQNRTYTCFELNRLLREGHRLEAEVVGYPGEHRGYHLLWRLCPTRFTFEWNID